MILRIRRSLAKFTRWVKGEGILANKNSIFVFGRIILSLWIVTLCIVALIVGLVFISNPEGFLNEKPKKDCFTVEVNGEAVDSCEYLTP